LTGFFRFGSAKVRRLFDFPSFYLDFSEALFLLVSLRPSPFRIGSAKVRFFSG
jgi:hypothetical protein